MARRRAICHAKAAALALAFVAVGLRKTSRKRIEDLVQSPWIDGRPTVHNLEANGVANSRQLDPPDRVGSAHRILAGQSSNSAR